MIRDGGIGRAWWVSGLIAFVLFCPRHAASSDQSVYRVTRAAFTAGGISGANGQHSVSGTLGQPTPIGIGTAGDKTLYAGIYDRNIIATSTGYMRIADASRLHQNYPNPFNPSTTISYTVGHGGLVTIEVYSVNGQKIRVLVDEVMEPGTYSVTWDGRNENNKRVSTGLYFCRLRIGSFSTVRKMLLLQ